ncbi:WecB/TagA/CpsF family glycosyltransferase [Clostridium tarantellae]|uniref:N-acetylglucosaminyldiphosphoundecaprenol N-acetyl-beta-D-mannosaminyltransferase n=1 Tax=Clostridium tarantellae TaxID=39493 RepID=A0A6I1ML53_9CLOT|nr:WecB/TagA/CpsF family glycosyltransferase [Clostridium tarantellae]MPQ44236.1 WecB/TagA/CpsF family glycosyltransferase [Clostridium tarantellae]
MYKRLLGYNIFSGSKEELLNEIIDKKKVNIISGNPEVLNHGLNNELLYKSFNSNDAIIIPDGIGTIIASKLYGNPIQEKIAGIEVMDLVLDYCNKKRKNIYLLGANENIVKICSSKINKKYSFINVVGTRNGFFDLNNCEDIIKDIKTKKTYVLFVAMGAPRQELFIEKYKDKLECSIFMGVGGSFDVISGEVERAPKWMISLGLEWFYRVIKEPWRVKRLKSIPKFIIKCWKEKK